MPTILVTQHVSATPQVNMAAFLTLFSSLLPNYIGRARGVISRFQLACSLLLRVLCGRFLQPIRRDRQYHAHSR